MTLPKDELYVVLPYLVRKECTEPKCRNTSGQPCQEIRRRHPLLVRFDADVKLLTRCRATP